MWARPRSARAHTVGNDRQPCPSRSARALPAHVPREAATPFLSESEAFAQRKTSRTRSATASISRVEPVTSFSISSARIF